MFDTHKEDIMPRKPTKYIVELTDEQRSELLSLVNKGEHNACVIKRANTLRLSEEGKTAPEIAEDLPTSQQTVYNIRKRLVQEGLDSAVYDKPRPGAKPKFRPEQEAHVIAVACSEPPDGRERWTVRLLTQKVVELGIIDEVSRETVRRTLKKTFSSHGRRSNGVYPG